MNGYEEHLQTLATLKAQLEEAQQLLRATQRLAGRLSRRATKAKERVTVARLAGLSEYMDFAELAEAQMSHAEALNALDDLSVSYLRLADAASQLGNHIQEGIRQRYYA